MECIFKSKLRIVVAVLLSMIVLLAGIVAYAQQPYTKSSELVCDNVKAQIVTKCVDDSYLPFPFCTEQRFTFIEQKTGKVTIKSASGKLVDELDAKGRKIRQSLDALATELHCVKGKTQSYLIVWYYTGGNCDECEWQELFDLKGKKLASTRPKTKRNMNAFDRIWSQLGLPDMQRGGSVPGSSHIDIPLKRTDK